MPDIYNSIKDFTSLIIPLIIAFASLVFVFTARKTKFGQLTADIDKNEGKQIDTQLEFKSAPTDTDVSATINERQFLLLKQYHSQGLTQSRISFWFSLIFAALGFAVIVIAILTVDKDKSFWTQTNSIVSIISGSIIDSVSALFFVQSNKSRELMANFFEKLRTDRKIEESLKLADSIPDEILRSKLKMILSLHFAEITTSDNTVSIIFKDLQDNNKPKVEVKGSKKSR